jgi:predicted peptidase
VNFIQKAIFIFLSGVFFMSNTVSAQQLKLETLPSGVHKQVVIHPDGTMQRYTISIPEKYDGKVAIPMILGLHYGYERSAENPRPVDFYGNEFYEKIYKESFKPLKVIFLAPDSINGRWSTPENEAAVMKLMDGILSTYNIDKKKTIITGFSMGAFGTWHIASKFQDRFAAAMPIAGIPANMETYRENLKFLDTDWKIPLYVMHSRIDEVVDFGPTETYVNQLLSQGKDVTFHILDDLTHHETTKYAEPVKDMVPWVENVWMQIH